MSQQEERLIRSRFARAEKTDRGNLVLTKRDEDLLVDLFLHQAMDRGQLQELHFSSVARCNLRLRKLFDHGYLARDFHPMAPYGSQGIYRIGRKAASVIARRLDTDAAQVKKLCQGSKRPEFLEHTLAIAGFYLATRRAIAAQDAVTLESWMPELQVRHEYEVQSVTGAWQKQVFKPDAFLRLKAGQCLFPFFIEVDRGNASARTFSQKIDHYQSYRSSGLFQEMYGGDSFGVLVVTTGARRLLHLKDITLERGGDFFLFTTMEELRTDGLLASIWQGAQSSGKIKLMDLGGG